MIIINGFTLTAWGSTSDVYRRQILTSKVRPRAVVIKSLTLANVNMICTLVEMDNAIFYANI